MVRILLLRKDGKVGEYQRSLTKKWKSNHIYDRKERVWKHKEEPKKEEVDAWEVISQTSVNTRREGKYDTKFSYSANGIFEHEPKPELVEKMIKNSMIKAFNSGEKKGRYIQKNLFGELVDTGIRGVEIRKVKVRKSQVQNTMKLVLSINNNGKKWKGEN